MFPREEKSPFSRFTRNFWDEKSVANKPRNCGGPRRMGARRMGEYCNLNGNIGHDTALLNYRTSQYAFIYSLKLF